MVRCSVEVASDLSHSPRDGKRWAEDEKRIGGRDEDEKVAVTLTKLS